MSDDDEQRLVALYEQASNERDPKNVSQLVAEILAILEANEIAHEK